MKRWRRFLALDAAERRVFLSSLALLPATAVVLRWRGFAAAQAFLERMPALGGRKLASTAAARMVGAAASLVGASCLPRSLVLWRLVRAQGAVIRLGVARPSSQSIAAHAWVELAGQPLNDAPDVAERYAALEPGTHGLRA